MRRSAVAKEEIKCRIQYLRPIPHLFNSTFTKYNLLYKAAEIVNDLTEKYVAEYRKPNHDPDA